MPTLQIDGVGRVEVDDSFLSMSADDRQRFVNHVFETHKSGKKTGSFDPRPDAGIGENFAGGVAQTLADVTKTASRLGFVDKTTAKAADDIAQRTYGGRSGSERFFGNDTSFNSGINAAAEGIAPMAMDIGAGAAGARIGALAGGAIGSLGLGVGAVPGAALGATVGGGLGYIGSNFLRNYGSRLDAREEANNGKEATFGDKAVAAATSIPAGLVDRFMVGRALPGKSELADKGLKAGLTRVVDAAGAGAMGNVVGDTIEQVGRNVGTENGQTDIEQTGKAALLGAAVGGGVRGLGEAKNVGQDALNKRSLRGFEFKEDVKGLGDEVVKVASDNGLDINKPNDAAKVLQILEEQAKAERNRSSESAKLALRLAEQNGIAQETITKATAALDSATPRRSHVEALQQVVEAAKQAAPERTEGFQATVDLAKKAANLRQLIKQSNISEDFRGRDKVSGGVSGAIDRATKGLASWVANVTGVTSGIVGASSYAGYAGLPVLGKVGAVLTNAAPFAGTAALGYMGLAGIDKALNLRNPVKRFIAATDGGSAPPPVAGGGGGMAAMQERLQQMAQAEQMAQQAAAQERARQKADAATARGVQDLLKQRSRATAFDEEAFLGKVEKAAAVEEKAQLKAQEAADAKAAKEAPQITKGLLDLAKAQQKLDVMRGIINEPSHYESITQQPMSLADVKTQRSKVEAEIAKQQIAAAHKKATEAQLAAEAQKKAPVAPKPKEEPAPKQEKPQAKKTDEPTPVSEDTRYKTDEIKNKDAYKAEVDLRQQMRDSTVSNFMKGYKFKGKQASYIEIELAKLNGTWNNIETVLANFKKMGERYKGLEKKLLDHFYEGGASNPDNYLNRTYNSKRLKGKVKTGRDGDISAGRKRKRDD